MFALYVLDWSFTHDLLFESSFKVIQLLFLQSCLVGLKEVGKAYICQSWECVLDPQRAGLMVLSNKDSYDLQICDTGNGLK